MTLRQVLRGVTRSRRSYLRRPTRAGLRRYLIWKARRAVKRGNLASGWDPRMCRYYGVSANVNDGCKRAIVRGYAGGLVPTSTTGGQHAPGSYHPKGQAVDLGLVEREIGTDGGRRRMFEHQLAEHRLYHRGELARMVELIGPDNRLVVLRDRETDLPEGAPLEDMHDTHVHEAFTG